MAIKRKKTTKIFSSILRFIVANYLIFIIIGCVGFVGVVSIYKLYIKKPTYIYVKVKVGQGYWWASTQKPSYWYIRAIQNAKEQKDIVGNSIAKITRVAYYPYYGSGQYDGYVTLKIQVTKVGGTGDYSFNREVIGIGSPIDLEFPTVNFSGTIIQLSEKPLIYETTLKTVYLSKKYSYPWEYDAIQIGDSYSDGNSIVVEILDKAKSSTNEVYTYETGKLVSADLETYTYIILKAKVRVHMEEGKVMYGDDVSLAPGKSFGFITDNFNYNDYIISKIE